MMWVVLLSVVEAVQMVMVAGWLAGRITFLKVMKTEVFYYLLFCVASLGLGYCLKRLVSRKQGDDRFWGQLKSFCVVETLLVFFLLSAVFKTIIYDSQGQLARNAYQALLVVAVFNKVFWFKISDFGKTFYGFITREQNIPSLIKIADMLFVVLILLILFVPDPESVVARMFIGEQFHHWDSSVLSAGWAYVKGCVLNVDVISRYGLGMPIIISELTKIFGGFNFEHVLLVLVWMAIIYYILWYWLLRLWFKSALVAMAAILMGIKVQVFRSDGMPFIFTYPSATILRYFLDIFVLALIYSHLRHPRKIYLAAAAAICGAALFHNTPEGLYLTAAFYFYLTAHLILPSLRARIYERPRDLIFLGGYVALVPITMLGLMLLTQGAHFWGEDFWKNLFEFVGYHTSGFVMTPIYQSLKDHNYLASLVGFLIPILYFLTVIVTVSLIFFRKIDNRHLFAAVLGIYGLGLYHYYVGMSNNVSYYGAGLPYIFLCFYWADRILSCIPNKIRLNIALGLLALMIYCLATTHLFLAYPNILNVSRNPMVDPLVTQIPIGRQSYFHHLFWEYPDAFKLPVNSLGETDEGLRKESDFSSDAELKAYYRQEFDFSVDASLIRQFTSPNEKVALISSFEIRILMQADRKPFFYYFPLVNSRPMRMRMFVVPNYFTLDSTKRTIDQLVTDKPEYVFMEAIFLNRNVPQAYYHDSQGFMELVDYVNEHYTPLARGKYLVALKRNI